MKKIPMYIEISFFHSGHALFETFIQKDTFLIYEQI